MTLTEAKQITGGGLCTRVSKMPGTTYGLPASRCIMGAKLRKAPGSVCSVCYAFRGNYQFASVRRAQEARLQSITDPLWVEAMALQLNHWHSRSHKNRVSGYHRWHDSGDLQSDEHLARIIEIAWLTPTIKHWLPTRELAIVKRGGFALPPNLTIRVSAPMIDGPAPNWPTTSGVHTVGAPNGAWECPAHWQQNKCGDCRACWDKGVKHVSYPKH